MRPTVRVSGYPGYIKLLRPRLVSDSSSYKFEAKVRQVSQVLDSNARAKEKPVESNQYSVYFASSSRHEFQRHFFPWVVVAGVGSELVFASFCFPNQRAPINSGDQWWHVQLHSWHNAASLHTLPLVFIFYSQALSRPRAMVSGDSRVETNERQCVCKPSLLYSLLLVSYTPHWQFAVCSWISKHGRYRRQLWVIHTGTEVPPTSQRLYLPNIFRIFECDVKTSRIERW